MRAICEACARPQPLDWRAGDLCVHCGQAVRQETRCFWCARWTPAGRMCRRCGAQIVAADMYGPARMLKDGGADRFSIPRMLAEFDAAQLDTFRSLYTRHLAVARRHVDDLRLLERYLHHRHWSAALEDQLTAELPWPDDRLEALLVPPLGPVSDDEAVGIVAESSPFELTRTLAALVRLHSDPDPAPEALTALHAADPRLREEAALHLSDWPVLYGSRGITDRAALIAELRRSPFPEHASVRLALIDRDAPAADPVLLASPDAGLAFLAALACGSEPRLRQALDAASPLKQYAAACALIRLRSFQDLGPAIERASPERQCELLRLLAAARIPAPELRETLFALIERPAEDRVPRLAATVLCRGIDRAAALRLLDAAGADRDIFHALLLADLSPDLFGEVGRQLIARGLFAMSQYGLTEAAKPGRMPAGFVPGQFHSADAATQEELIRFAEEQVEARPEGDAALDRFLVRLCFTTLPKEVRSAAWSAMRRVTMHRQYASACPFLLSRAGVERYFSSMPEFLESLAALLDDAEALTDVLIFDPLARFLNYPEDDFAPAARPAVPRVPAILPALERAAGDDRYWPMLRSACEQLARELAGPVV